MAPWLWWCLQPAQAFKGTMGGAKGRLFMVFLRQRNLVREAIVSKQWAWQRPMRVNARAPRLVDPTLSLTQSPPHLRPLNPDAGPW